MREERKLNKAIRQDGIDTQSEILEELKRRYPQYVEQPGDRKAFVRKKRVAVISTLAAVVASVAIIVPCAVLLPNKTDDGNVNTDRYCAVGEYSDETCEYTLREYSEKIDGAVLYFNWYDKAEDLFTTRYISNDDKEILCVEEYGYLVESDEMIYLSVTKSNVYLGMFDLVIKDCTSEQSVNNHNIKWTIKRERAQCIFEDNGYRYFIQIIQGQDENRLFELVAELLETK